MSVVIDASVLIAALIDGGPGGAWAENILGNDSLFAPELARVQAANVLRHLERAKHLTTSEANAAHEDLMDLDLELVSFEPFAERIWELRHTLTSDDAWSIAVAEALRIPLATLDERLCTAKGIACELLTPETSRPNY